MRPRSSSSSTGSSTAAGNTPPSCRPTMKTRRRPSKPGFVQRRDVEVAGARAVAADARATSTRPRRNRRPVARSHRYSPSVFSSASALGQRDERHGVERAGPRRVGLEERRRPRSTSASSGTSPAASGVRERSQTTSSIHCAERRASAPPSARSTAARSSLASVVRRPTVRTRSARRVSASA